MFHFEELSYFLYGCLFPDCKVLKNYLPFMSVRFFSAPVFCIEFQHVGCPQLYLDNGEVASHFCGVFFVVLDNFITIYFKKHHCVLDYLYCIILCKILLF